MTDFAASWPRLRMQYVQLWLVVFLLFYSHVSGENDDESTGNFFVDILINIWLLILNLFSGGRTPTSCPSAARCGLWGLFYLSHTGIPGTPSCKEECVFWAPPADQCGGCGGTVAPTLAPTPIVLSAHPTVSPVRNEETSFDITLDLSLVPPLDHSYFTKAAKRWERVITGDLEPVKTYYFEPKYEGCFHPSNRQIDDVYICARYAAHDGLGGIVAYGEPDWTRGLRGLPASGYMTVDQEDLVLLKDNNIFQDLIEHEIGHILGIGTQWYNIGVVGPGNFCPYLGTHANSEYQTLTGCANIPTELDGGGATRCSHFDEECLDNELMTGYINSDKENLLSRLTVATLEDLGYQVNYAEADDFGSLNIPAQCRCGLRRSLVAIRELILFSSDSVVTGNSIRRTQISEEMRSYAVRQGHVLLRDQANRVSPLNPNWNDLSNVNDADLPTFVGDQWVSMWVQDKDDGGIFSVTVWADD